MNIEDLASLGDVSKFDISRIRKNTQTSMRSHLNLIRRNGIELTRDYVQKHDMNDTLDRLKTRKGEPLKSEYKIQIAATLKRLYGPDMVIDVNVYRNDVLRHKPHAENFEMMEKIKKLINHAAAFVRNVENENAFATELASYEAALAILMSSSTSHRIAELHQLTMQNLDDILQHKPIFLHSKGHKSSTTRCEIVPNKLLVSCIAFVIRNRANVIRGARIHERSNRYPEYTNMRIKGNNVFIVSVSQLRRAAKQLAVSFSLDIENLGFNKFRKYITSILVDGGGHNLAQFINAHSNVNTTLTNYDVGTKISMEKTLNSVIVPPVAAEPSTVTGTQSIDDTYDYNITKPLSLKEELEQVADIDKNKTYFKNRVNRYDLPETPITPSVMMNTIESDDEDMEFI